MVYLLVAQVVLAIGTQGQLTIFGKLLLHLQVEFLVGGNKKFLDGFLDDFKDPGSPNEIGAFYS